MQRKLIPKLVNNETFVTAWNEWAKWKRFGLPHGQGWLFERPLWIQAIEILEQEFELYQSREMEGVHNNR